MRSLPGDPNCLSLLSIDHLHLRAPRSRNPFFSEVATRLHSHSKPNTQIPPHLLSLGFPIPPLHGALDVLPMDLLVAAGATAICFLVAVFTLRLRGPSGKNSQRCVCACSCGEGVEGDLGMARVNGEVGGKGKGKGKGKEKELERQVGASMMEQLVPEITTHALSYLDYPSLCRLSMTNSSMRRAANDDNAWKALYHKDFTVEQDSVTPPNGWKAYYAATKAIINLNAEFYSIIRERSLPAMSHFWLQADYVKCIHGSGELFSGYAAVIDSWALAFNWAQGGQGVAFQIRDVRSRVLSDMAWVTMKAYVDMDSGPFHVTNIYEFHNGRWYMVHHHSSVMLVDGDPGQQNVFG